MKKMTAQEMNWKNNAMDLCKKYYDARAAYKDDLKMISLLEKKRDEAKTVQERTIIGNGIVEKTKQSEHNAAIVTLFETGLLMIDDQESSVLQQLFSEHKDWEDISDLQGTAMKRSTVRRLRNSGLIKLGAFMETVTEKLSAHGEYEEVLRDTVGP